MSRSFGRRDILGCPFDSVSFEETVETIRSAVLEGRRLQVVPGNVDFVMKARRDPEFARELRGADLVVADGQFVTWAAALLGQPLRRRVSGTDLVWECARISAETGCTVALVGGMPGIAEQAAAEMTRRHPAASLHAVPTPWPLGSAENRALVAQVRAIAARIVLVALGAPRQERWVQAHLDASGASVGIGVGSAFDIISGDKPRAPEWMQKASLEWFHRLTLEPRRLAWRYLVEDSPFLLHLAAAAAQRPIGRPRATALTTSRALR
jgi:N-acetylglucosaminyldiphosphoundecaprenol N-acetyl-beta-D-mannosaminyltransferase